jgi:hypothetical protein
MPGLGSTPAPHLNDLAIRLAPEIRFHSKEQFGPCSVEWLLNRCDITAHLGDLTWTHGGEIYLPSSMSVTKSGPLQPSDLTAATHSTDYRDQARNKDVGIWPMVAPAGQDPTYTQKTDSWYFSDYQRSTLVGELPPTSDPTRIEGAACYVHISREADWYLINYYFLCAYNGAMGMTTDWTAPPLASTASGGGFEQHIGDVMRVAARITYDPAAQTYSLLAVKFDGHGNTEVVSDPPFAFSNLPLDSVPSLTVYSAWHSHEMYPSAGAHSIPLPAPPGTHDYTDDGGLHWITQNSLVFASASDPAWIDFNGNLGNNVHYTPFIGQFVDILAIGPCLFTFKSDWLRGYTNGMHLRDPQSGSIYLMIDDTLRHVPNGGTFENLFPSWDAVPITLGNLPVGDPITDGAYLAQATGQARQFLIIDGTKRWIASPAIFASYWFDSTKIRSLSPDVLNAIPDGPPLATQTAYAPDGVRIRDASSGRIYLVLDGMLRWVPDAQTYVQLFIDWSSAISLPNVENYVIGPQLTEGASLAQGSGQPAIYLLVDGSKRLIASPAVMQRFGFAPAAVTTVDAAVLAALPDGISLV